MKLKYYLMGLGVGIILTAIIFMVSGYRKKPSDEEIKNRALQLGMVVDKKQEDSLNKIMQDVEPTKSPTGIPAKVKTAKGVMTQTPKPTKKPTSIATKESTLKPTKVPTMKPMKEPSVNSVVKFTIEPGMSSQEISGILYKKGLVDNSSNFNAYITALDKAGDIRIGSYAISHGATYNEIVKEIAP